MACDGSLTVTPGPEERQENECQVDHAHAFLLFCGVVGLTLIFLLPPGPVGAVATCLFLSRPHEKQMVIHEASIEKTRTYIPPCPPYLLSIFSYAGGANAVGGYISYPIFPYKLSI